MKQTKSEWITILGHGNTIDISIVDVFHDLAFWDELLTLFIIKTVFCINNQKKTTQIPLYNSLNDFFTQRKFEVGCQMDPAYW